MRVLRVSSKQPARAVLEALLAALQSGFEKVTQALAEVRTGQDALGVLKSRVESVLERMRQHPGGLNAIDAQATMRQEQLLGYLAVRQQTSTLDDCPLPELYRHLQGGCPNLTVGQYHDSLRRLSENGQVYLHPWTGPLYELPEPALALLVGHEVAYYASLCLRETLAA